MADMECPNCNVKLPRMAAFRQLYTCKSCNMILVQGKEVPEYFFYGLILLIFIFRPFSSFSTELVLMGGAVCVILVVLWTALKTTRFRIKGSATTLPKKEKVDDNANIRKHINTQKNKREFRDRVK